VDSTEGQRLCYCFRGERNGNRLYVGNLSYNVTEAELKEVFAEGGKNVVEVKIVLDRDTGRPRGFAFVEMGSDGEAAQAIETLNGREIQGGLSA